MGRSLDYHASTGLGTLLQSLHALRKFAIHVDPWDFETEFEYITYDDDFRLFFKDLDEISNKPDSESESDDTRAPQFTFLPVLEELSLVIRGFRKESEMDFAFLDGDCEFLDVVALRFIGPLKRFSVQVFGTFEKGLLEGLENTITTVKKLGGMFVLEEVE